MMKGNEFKVRILFFKIGIQRLLKRSYAELIRSCKNSGRRTFRTMERITKSCSNALFGKI